MSETIVISAIALKGGGTLSILQDCLDELDQPRYDGMTVYVLMKDRRLIDRRYEKFHFIELDGARSYFNKFYYEYFYFKKLSRKLNADLWLSLHDITPNVKAKTQAVYCHNASPFYSISLREFGLDPKFGMFTFFYRFLYQINIRRNAWVIVQQSWMRTEFVKRFNLKKERVIVSRPSTQLPIHPYLPAAGDIVIFLYPTFPRVFKNVEVIAEAVAILNARNIQGFEVILTVDGSENGYARWLKLNYARLSGIRWIGQQTRQEIFTHYDRADCLIFPSKLETWGLPISEFKPTAKPILAADLPYAKETIGDYQRVAYFNPSDASELAGRMQDVITGKIVYAAATTEPVIEEPKADNWASLFTLLLGVH